MVLLVVPWAWGYGAIGVRHMRSTMHSYRVPQGPHATSKEWLPLPLTPSVMSHPCMQMQAPVSSCVSRAGSANHSLFCVRYWECPDSRRETARGARWASLETNRLEVEGSRGCVQILSQARLSLSLFLSLHMRQSAC